MCICEKPSHQCSSRSARAPRFFTASSRARATFSRSKARARDGPGSPSPPHLPSSFVARDDGFLLDAFPRRARRRGVGVRIRARRERVVPRREGQLQRPHARLDQGDVRDVHRELRHAALRRHPRVRPPATSRLFSASGRRARAPTRARFGRPGATISFSSRPRRESIARPDRASPRPDPPAPPSPPPQRHAGVPPLGQGRVRSVRGARATRPFISLASSPSRRRPIRRRSFFFPPSSPPLCA